MPSRLLRNKFIRYGIIGGVSTTIHGVVAFAMLFWIGLTVIPANLAGFLIAYLFSYTVQSRYVFSHSLSVAKATKYFLVQLAALLVSLGSTGLLRESNPYFKTVIVVIIMPIITYAIHKVWTFSHPKEPLL